MTLLENFKFQIPRSKPFYIFFLLAILFRLVIMATTYHPDVRAAEFASYAVVEMRKGFGFYDVLPSLSPSDPLYRALGPTELNYPPLAWLAPVVFRFIFRPLMNPALDHQIFTNVEALFGSTQLMWHLLVLKLPLLLADLATAWFLTFFFANSKEKATAFLAWLFNPITLYASFAVGQIDIWPVLVTVAAGVFLARNRPSVAALLLGLGGGYKLFPLLLLLPTALLFGKDHFEKAKLVLIGVTAYLAVVLPFALTSPGFRAYSLLTPQTDKMLFAKVMVSGDQFLSLFVVGFFALTLLCTYARRQYWMIFWAAALLLLLSVTHYHPQWFLWVTPWLIIFGMKEKTFWWMVLALLMADLGITLSFDSSLHFGLLAPIFPWVVNIPYGVPLLVSKFIPFPVFVSLVRSFLAAVSMATVYRLWENRSRFKV